MRVWQEVLPALPSTWEKSGKAHHAQHEVFHFGVAVCPRFTYVHSADLKREMFRKTDLSQCICKCVHFLSSILS